MLVEGWLRVVVDGKCGEIETSLDSRFRGNDMGKIPGGEAGIRTQVL